jgi:hygromycin-B 7''-O-kinase
MNLLPQPADAEAYSKLFKQDTPWESAIQFLSDKYALTGDRSRAKRGSHIVYRVGNSWIKLMAPLFAKDMVYEIAGLTSVQEQLSVASPQIIANGLIENWPYLIVTHIEGDRIGEVWSKLSDENKIHLARQMGATTKSLQNCRPDQVVSDRNNWNSFIKDRLKNLVPHHRAKKMSEKWLQTLPHFMDQFSPEEFLCDNPVFLHADLTWDHFLVHTINNQPHISGVIDFADCRIGHPEYDIPATAAFILKSQDAPLREYLLSLGYKDLELNSRFSEKMLAWTCLHYYSDLKNYFESEMQQLDPGDFRSLARIAYPL